MEKRDELESPDTAQEEDQRQVEHLTCPMQISDLNVYCLIHIFKQLGVLDRLRLEDVSEGWQKILKQSWSDVKTLRFDDYHGWGLKKDGDLGKLSTRDLKKILSRCGKYTNYVDLYEDEEVEDLDPNVLDTITKHCPDIEYIRVICPRFTPASLRVLAEKCSKIIELSLENFINGCDEELALLFRRNSRLRSLRLNENSELTGECLAALNADSIEAITLEACANVNMENLGVLRNFNNLKTLELYCFLNTISVEEAEVVSECFRTLKKFKVHCYPGFPFSSSMMTKLRNMEYLEATENDLMTDDLLVAIGYNCKLLKELNISACSLVTNRGLAAILTLPDLKVLCVNDISRIDDTVFYCAPKLVELYCGRCINMGDTGIARLIKNSHRIEEISLSGCPNISNTLIKDAIRYTKERKNNVVLKLNVDKRQVNLDEIADSSPLLSVQLFG